MMHGCLCEVKLQAFQLSLLRRRKRQRIKVRKWKDHCMSFAKKIVKRIVSAEALKSTVSFSAVHPWPRKALNALHGKLTMQQRSRFHEHFAKLFRDRDNSRIFPGVWKVNFAGREIILPLSDGRFWLDWDIALSIDGHDTEIKETYSAILSGSEKLDTFIDVGGNYGTHSLIFLVHGVDVYTFEPNPMCHEYFLDVCKLNGVTPRLEDAAVGESDQPLKLSFPESETWLGSVEPATIEELHAIKGTLSSKIVPQRRIDDFLPFFKPGNMLIKIDAEGFEPEVLRGSKKTLQAKKPMIIFEAVKPDRRPDLFDLFDLLGYGISSLPWTGRTSPVSLAKSTFLNHSLQNFLAFPLDVNRV
jgi:FkbM family methyltransferase